MNPPVSSLGTLLRHLVETLDGAVEDAYVRAGLNYRPRFTPVFRTLLDLGPSSIRTIAARSGITHSAASQTVSQMTKQGLVRLEAGDDARERIVALTPAARRMLPALERCWAATQLAAQALETELSAPLSTVLHDAIDALEKRSFNDRLEAAAGVLKRAGG